MQTWKKCFIFKLGRYLEYFSWFSVTQILIIFFLILSSLSSLSNSAERIWFNILPPETTMSRFKTVLTYLYLVLRIFFHIIQKMIAAFQDWRGRGD